MTDALVPVAKPTSPVLADRHDYVLLNRELVAFQVDRLRALIRILTEGNANESAEAIREFADILDRSDNTTRILSMLINNSVILDPTGPGDDLISIGNAGSRRSWPRWRPL